MDAKATTIGKTTLLLAAAMGAGWLGARLGAPASPAAPPVSPAAAARPAEPTAAEASAPRPTTAVTAPAAARPARPLPPLAPRARPTQWDQPPPAPVLSGGEAADDKVRRARALLASADANERIDGLHILYAADPDQGMAEAHARLGDRDVALAGPAARVLALGSNLAADDVAAMEEMLADGSQTAEARTAVAGSLLGALRSTDSPALEGAFGKAIGSDVPWVRGAAVANVASLPSERAIPLLAQALGDPDEAVAKGAMSALVGLHGGDAKLGNDPGAWKRWWADRQAARAKTEAEAVALRDAQPAVIPGSGEPPEPPAPAAIDETSPPPPEPAAHSQE